jgi:branched-chain amino acid transport system ATP-binding protein
METLLELKGVSRRFGGFIAVRKVDLTVAAGEIHCLMGPNGAGKSTLFKLVVGRYEPARAASISAVMT